MATSTDRKVSVSRPRPTPSRIQDLAATPESPRTPLLRSTSSIYGSPGGSFRSEEEYIVLELGSRYLRGGFPGESAPRCTLNFGPDQQRRVGDYRQWNPEYASKRRKRKRGEEWGREYELYRMDLRDEDLGLIEDKFERAMREAHNKYFLLDPKPRRVLLALPPLMPRELLSTFLSVLFTNFQAPSVTLLSSPILSAVAAGLRSALVIDMGWAETTITGVYEFREVHQRRSIRAGKYLSEEMAKMLNEELAKRGIATPGDDITFEEAEEVLSRVGWCDTLDEKTSNGEDEFVDAPEELPDPSISIPFPLAIPPTTLTLPFSALSSPAETAIFASATPLHDFDDHDLPLHILAYRALLSLPIDVRKVCMSRIIITGGVSNLPGLKTRLLKEVDKLVQQKRWDNVKSYGSANEKHERLIRERQQRLQARTSDSTKVADTTDPDIESTPVLAGLAEPETDPIADKLAHLNMKMIPTATNIGGVIRGVESLGAWAGASLIAQMRVKGIVEIERDKFLQHGLQGASREKEISVVPQRQSMGPGMRPGAGDRGSWTLGVWA
ncbi:actin-like ATPase domain-containing protein [Mytilinidion resinicola]|uniref:Actin-like ATPase domain-containing protein n=1 Tax=Mytilinidion resinicola TaxID=574789 RepID=A0A6A6YAA0_9PEZI|nr:actin-like ATPase domain-containing protein [Mytilinidion resinicola]KAF2805045.1 actin-like ATPase domain-containing protein [Mytilinidion resinicola]